ncbi:glutathione S-transferase [Phascolomyces articulosus]|uniref:Glutathione S-transferase n=1 Tax=Phascolomyces articulosus TaxID=60185 RepID=A0AAD5K3E0_9FUNG|nr:glutathione S-transferase [Phascolomyces articulosus]
MSLSNVKLVYFNFGTMGRAESIKLLLEDAAIPHQFERVDRDTEWEGAKEKLIAEGYPCGCVPYIELDGKKYFGSTPILRFLSKKLNKYRGSNDDEEQYVDACSDLADDFYFSYLKCLLGPTEENLKEYSETQAPKHYSRFERIYGTNEGPFILGSEISYADFMVYHTIDDQKRTQDLKGFPNLAKFIEAFSARENIAKYFTVNPPKTQ